MTRVSLSDELSESDWLLQLEALVREDGTFHRLGRDHVAVHSGDGHDLLFVSFEGIAALRATAPEGLPLGFTVAGEAGWSHLNLIALRDTWFRDRDVYAFFDRLIEEGAFEEYDRVVFYGAGMGGYAALAFSVAAPGATVIAVAPQATLDRRWTAWDARFPAARRMAFTGRFDSAPDMAEAAERVVLIHDPSEIEDAMHASLFRSDNVLHVRYRRGRSGAIDADMKDLGLLTRLLLSAEAGAVSLWAVSGVFRARRDHLPYLRALLARVLAQERPWLTALLCRAVLRRHRIPRFAHHLDMAEAELLEAGRALPGERMADG